MTGAAPEPPASKMADPSAKEMTHMDTEYEQSHVPAGVINFGVGQPSPRLLPFAEFAAASQASPTVPSWRRAAASCPLFEPLALQATPLWSSSWSAG